MTKFGLEDTQESVVFGGMPQDRLPSRFLIINITVNTREKGRLRLVIGVKIKYFFVIVNIQ